MKKKINRVFVVILLIAGFSLLLYPFVANQWNNYRQKQLMNGYDQTISEKEDTGAIDYAAEKKAAEAYNEDLLPSILPDSFAVAQASEEDERYMSCLNITGNGMMGSVEIPEIDIKLPVFHTTSEEVLEVAAGHLEGSSLPVGGENTHAVISAHRGLPSATLFTNLDKLEEGDHFLLHILDETLCYEVDKITVVEPKDTKDLRVEDGEDLVTLMTCTPYGVNSHRLLVRGHRVPYDPEAIAEEADPFGSWSLHTSYLLWAVVGILIAAIFSFLLYKREKRLSARNNEKKAAKTVPKKTSEKIIKRTDKTISGEMQKDSGDTKPVPEDQPENPKEASEGLPEDQPEKPEEASGEQAEEPEAVPEKPEEASEELSEEAAGELSEETFEEPETVSEVSEEYREDTEAADQEPVRESEEGLDGSETQETGEEEQP